MSIAIIDMICYHTKNKNMLEYQAENISDKDMKDLVDRFFDFHDKQCEVKEDEYDNFFIERDDIDNRRPNWYYACLKKIIFKKNGNIDVEMCIGNNKTSYTVNITEYKTIQPTNDFYQEYSVLQPFNWTNLNQGDLTKDNVFGLFNDAVKDQKAFNSFKDTLIRQISTVFEDKINQKLNQELCGNEQKNNSLMSVDVPMINIMMANDGKENNINQNIHQDANVNPPACDALETEIKQTLEEFMSDIELTQPTQGKADIVIKNKSCVVKNNNKITLRQISILPNNMIPSSRTDVKFDICINEKQYSIPYNNNVLPCVDGGYINKFLQKIENYFQNENNKKFFVEKSAKCLKEQIEQINEENNKIMLEYQNNNDIINHNKELSIIDENEELLYYNNNIVIDDKHITEAEDEKHTALNTNKKIERKIEKEKQINKDNEEQNDNIINQKALSIIDKNKELRHENNNVVTDKQKNPNENITNNAEDKKYTALNTDKNNENETYHNEDHYIVRKIRNCLSTIGCCDCLSLNSGVSLHGYDNSPYIFKQYY